MGRSGALNPTGRNPLLSWKTHLNRYILWDSTLSRLIPRILFTTTSKIGRMTPSTVRQKFHRGRQHALFCTGSIRTLTYSVYLIGTILTTRSVRYHQLGPIATHNHTIASCKSMGSLALRLRCPYVESWMPAASTASSIYWALRIGA